MIIERNSYIERLLRHKENSLIKVITGSRRSGKSFLLLKLFVQRLKEQGVDDAHIIKIALDDRTNKELRNPDIMLNFVKSKIADSKTYYILLDEIQYLDEFEDVLNSFLHIDNVDVYVTGSNSHLLSSDVITTFRGRGDEIHVFPLSFSEFSTAYKGSALEAWDSYVLFGGMPLTLSFESPEEKANYLKSLFDKIYVADILERYKVRNGSELDEILNILSSSVGSLTNPIKLSKTFKSLKNKTISDNTIRKYISYFEDAFLISKAIRYDIKGKRYINTPSKYYFEDVGLRNARLGFRQVEETHVMENIIYNELRFRGYMVDVGIVEINTQNNGKNSRVQLEVDFVATRGGEKLYIQSALNIDDAEKKFQEKRPLLNTRDSFKKIIVVKGQMAPRYDDDGIMTMGIINFLLNDSF